MSELAQVVVIIFSVVELALVVLYHIFSVGTGSGTVVLVYLIFLFFFFFLLFFIQQFFVVEKNISIHSHNYIIFQ